ncbi:HIRAN domain-containing protein [Caldifermentibacillus hisashii]
MAGWRYYEGEKVLQKFKINDEVRFELDLENPKDSKAVAVFTCILQ